MITLKEGCRAFELKLLLLQIIVEPFFVYYLRFVQNINPFQFLWSLYNFFHKSLKYFRENRKFYYESKISQ